MDSPSNIIVDSTVSILHVIIDTVAIVLFSAFIAPMGTASTRNVITSGTLHRRRIASRTFLGIPLHEISISQLVLCRLFSTSLLHTLFAAKAGEIGHSLSQTLSGHRPLNAVAVDAPSTVPPRRQLHFAASDGQDLFVELLERLSVRFLFTKWTQ